MQPALIVEGVTKRYGDFIAVDALSFQAAAGRIVGFLGPNGAGKTTTLRMALGLVTPSAGRIEVLGASDAAQVRARIGFLPEEPAFYDWMSPRDSSNVTRWPCARAAGCPSRRLILLTRSHIWYRSRMVA